MQQKHIARLLSNLEDPNAILIETHISWVILTGELAYKIKKPVRYSFLDFSSLARRRFYCFREVELNRRLTSDVYLDVVEIRQDQHGIHFGSPYGTLIDFAVKMSRLDKTRQMHLLLEQDAVTPLHMEQLADQLSTFHAFTDTASKAPDVTMMIEDFNDIYTVSEVLMEHLGPSSQTTVTESIEAAEVFLYRHAQRIAERYEQGFFVDGHGDLHSRNIFLLDQPVIFDCIEFNDHFRQLDVLDELAFFGLDLDLYGRQDLEEIFLNKYMSAYPCIHNEEDQHLFVYYKLYRANVKTKVHALKAQQTKNDVDLTHRIQRMESYFKLFRKYLSEVGILVTSES